MNEVNVTKLERKMIIDIMECENDGIGQGFSEFDGKGLTPAEKGVISNLIQKELIYDSYAFYEDTNDKMFCTCKTPETEKIAKSMNLKYEFE